MNQKHLEAAEIQTPVLIVGGALVGLSMSLFLAWQGIASVVVEKHSEPARLPRARGYNARTMELFRILGLEKTIHAAQPPNAENRGIVRVESLAGREIAHLDEGGQIEMSAFSPTTGCIIGQDRLEPILAEEAHRLGATIFFNTEMISFEQDETGISAIVRDRITGEERRVRAQYLIAADGSHSSVRHKLGIQAEGRGTVAYSTDVVFEADLHTALRGRRTYLYYVSNPLLPDGQGGLMPLDNERLWSFGVPIHPERGERREDLTDERCIELIHIATGIPDLEVKILPAYPWDTVKVGVWELAAFSAQRYQQGRIFLAGDAAHTVLPSGGLGAGTGIQDAFNLAWKLALVLTGKAGDGLLASYQEERLPIGKLTMEQTLLRHLYRIGTTDSQFIHDAELIFGFRYRSEAIISESGADQAPLTQDPQTLHGEPGTRMPHLLLEQAGTIISTIDLGAGRWMLLTGKQADSWTEAAQQIEQRFNLPLSIYTIPGSDGSQALGNAIYGIGEAGAVLVRPDGFVACRTTGQDGDPQILLEQVIARILCRIS